MIEILNPVRRHWRLLAALATVVLVNPFLPAAWPTTTRLLASWDIGILLYLGLVLVMAVRSTVAGLQRRSEGEMQRIVLAHTILPFFFNAGILTLAINVGAGLPEARGVRGAG